MKQHITVKQLDELEEKEKLEKWCFRKRYFNSRIPERLVMPLLSIGQMIEFLYEHKYDYGDVDFLTFDDSTPDICDALWEAVKEVLEQ